MCLDHAIHAVFRHVIKNFYGAFSRIRERNNFANSTFIGGDAAQPESIRGCLYLFNQLKREEGEDESLFLEHDHEHVLAQLDCLDHAIEGDLGTIFPLVVVPNNNFVARGRQDQHNEVSLVHHLDNLNRLV